MIHTIGDLMRELGKFDPDRRINMVDAVKYKDENGPEVSSLGISGIEAVLELKNGCVGIVTAEGLKTGSDIE